MEEAVTRQHAHPNTVYHCLYAYYKLGYTRQHLGHIFKRHKDCISLSHGRSRRQLVYICG
ncbi:hypothetical protein PF005_g24490 [Phytophthora fragariae]|uniref:Uncharacterized protein n=2 Tax=Phytophthora TaxID=4783 RepID=A0A6A3W570_9STRA|nr:hypothetical protein PR001_g4866 [Phytophthora rubi]KAE9045779.1 hypothetical protein PR002_g2027 [Phytophthora rubi]KAE9132684.1 hypothetical protein PF006_g15221 [Phytophthora fragariae]KAE9177451.1 hypothetical protein PF005_g24490 [Phytophthora fragariae]